ncbi:MAG: class I SAM-dependent methyltransferase [Nanoarchaeota archaeon]|nr:class I SAM-dependent methyltransferase [Nanoarchaeota archaeon]
MDQKFKSIILKRYSDKEFAKSYYGHSKTGLKDYESFLIEKFLTKCKDILVIGCGCGREVIPLAKRGFNVVAIDISEEMVKWSRYLCKEMQVEADILQMDATNLKFKSSSFDAVLLFNCIIDQIPRDFNRKKLVAEVYRVLKPAGICMAVSNNAFYPGRRFCFWIEHAKEIFPYLKQNSKREFFDRIYNDSHQKVYVHLSTPYYLKKLFKKQFKILLNSSTDMAKKRLKHYFSANRVIVCRKGK